MNMRRIAEQAGVSVATVSRVLNNQSGVRPELRDKILTIMKNENYVPGNIANWMKASKTKLIGVLVSDLKDIHFSYTISAIHDDLYAAGYTMVLGITSGDMSVFENYIKDFGLKQVDGIILVGSPFNDEKIIDYLNLVIKDTPIVMTNSDLNSGNIQSISVDVELGAFSVCKHLVQQGRKRIAFIGDVVSSKSGKRKLEGYGKALHLSGREFSAEDVYYVGGRYMDEAFSWATRNIEILESYDALMCSTDYVAIGIIRALEDAGIRIPQDIAITGYNNSVMSQYSNPPLTTVDNLHNVAGKLAVTMLKNAIENTEFKVDLNIRPELVIRNSSVS